MAVDGFAGAGLERIEDAGQAQLFEQGNEFGQGVHAGASLEQRLGVAAEPTTLGVGAGGRRGQNRGLDLVQTLGEDGFHRAVPDVAEAERPRAGGVQAGGPVGVLQAQHPLGGAQVDQHPVGEQSVDQGVATGADALGLAQTPPGIVEAPGQGLGRQMVGEGRAGAGAGQARVAGDLIVVAIEVDQGVAGLEPQGLADQAERHRVQAVRELDVGVAMDLDLGPHRQHRRHRGQRLQQGAFGRLKLDQRPLAGGAMAALAGLVAHPVGQLPVGVGQAAKFAQREEGALHVFDAGLHDPFLSCQRLPVMRTIQRR